VPWGELVVGAAVAIAEPSRTRAQMPSILALALTGGIRSILLPEPSGPSM
jgi:hypothetical protein